MSRLCAGRNNHRNLHCKYVAITVFSDTTQVVVWSVLKTGIGIDSAFENERRYMWKSFQKWAKYVRDWGETTDKAIEVLADVDVFPLVKVGNGNEIIKPVNFQVIVESENSDHKEKKFLPW